MTEVDEIKCLNMEITQLILYLSFMTYMHVMSTNMGYDQLPRGYSKLIMRKTNFKCYRQKR